MVRQITFVAGATFVALACEARGGELRPLSVQGAAPPEHAAQAMETLRSLGYVDFAAEPADPATGGAIVVDAQRVSPGYSLYVNRGACEAVLIGLHGDVVRSWHAEPCAWWSHARLTEAGELLVAGAQPSGIGPDGANDDGRELLRLDWSGRLLWRRRIAAHHDVLERADGRLVTLGERLRVVHGEAAPILDNFVWVLSPSGDLEQEVSLFDVCRENKAGFAVAPGPRDRVRAGAVDLFHANSVQWIEVSAAGHEPYYQPGNVLVSSRSQDTLFIIDVAARRLEWAWGRGVLSGPHDATLLASGNILVFDNGLGRGASRVLEVDPRRGEIVWQYCGDSPFYSASRGSAQRLANGNTLVANSDSGLAFEVAPSGDVVWRFANPLSDPDGRRATIVRMWRYPPGAVAPFIDVSLRAE